MSRPDGPAAHRAALLATVGVALRVNLRRLTTWVFAAVFVLIVFLLYRGGLRFGGMTASGVKLATNSEYAVAAVLGAFSFFLMHFTATLTGDPVVKDTRLGVAPLLHATPIGKRTYLLAKFLGGYASLLLVYAVFLAALVLGQLLPPSEDKLTLPFRLLPYVKFGLVFLLVPTFFVAAVSFAIGTLTCSMKAVYVTVTGLLVTWFLVIGLLGDEALRWLAYVEPSGQAWLAERIAKNRGNAFLNENPIALDAGFLLNRAVLAALGVVALAWTVVRWKPGMRDVEYSGEVSPGGLERLAGWMRGRTREVEDLYSNWSGRGHVPRVAPAERGLGAWSAQLLGSFATELRLLAAERSLWILVPMIMLVAGVDAVSHTGPFNVRVYPVSSEYAQQMVPALLILLAGTSIFYTGEVMHRDEELGLRGILYSTPIANSALLLSKLAAMVVLSAAMVLLTMLTGVVSQLVHWWTIDGRVHVELGPYAEVGLRVLLPSILFLCTAALAVNVLVRRRYPAYFLAILAAAGYVWTLFEGQRSLLHNPLFVGHWAYSDLVGMEPFHERLGWSYRYWGALLVALFSLSAWLLQRTQGRAAGNLSAAALRARPWAPVTCVLALVAAAWAGREIEARGTVRGTRAEIEEAMVAREARWLERLGGPRPTYRSVRFDADLDPATRSLRVSGEIVLTNAFPVPLEDAVFTLDPLLEVTRMRLEGASLAPERDGPIWRFELDEPLAPDGRLLLEYAWSGVVGPGWSESGGGQSSFLHARAVFLNSFSPQLTPLPGLDAGLFLGDRERRATYGLAPFEPLKAPADGAYVPALLGQDRPFDLVANIRAPRGLSVLCTGELVERRAEPSSEVWSYRSEAPVRSFAVLAADYSRASEGEDEIFHHASHTYNLDTISAALADARREFQASFGSYPHRRLRIAEFPRLARFATSFPTLMPYSESIGFLTHHAQDSRRIDATYFVTAHEVAHQWWAYIESPGLAPGAQVLSESLAEYSALFLIDTTRGERERLVFLKQEEDRYLRQRDPDTEVALADLQLQGAELWYAKGCLVLYMLERQLGRERLHAALSNFVARWRVDTRDPPPTSVAARRGHPTLDDLLAELRATHPGESFQWFYETWFERVVLPDMAFEGVPTLSRDGERWSVEFVATNLGEGRLPVRVEAVAGPWRPEQRGEDEEFEVSGNVLLWLEPGKSARGMLTCDFEPQFVVIDRLYECIDFDRTNNAVQPVRGAPGGSAPAGHAAAAGS